MDGHPQQDLENGPNAGDSVGGTTQTTLDLDDDDTVEDRVHDQLPSVEEYKTSMAGASTPSSFTSRESAGVGGSSGFVDVDDEEGPAHDLPTVEEYKAATAAAGQTANNGTSSGGNNCNLCCVLAALFFLGLLASAIIIPIALNSDGEGPRTGLFSRRKDVLEYLTRLQISDTELLNTPGTPQYEAALWIADHDAYRMQLPEGNSPHNRFVERYALAVFFYATGGPRWRYDANFLKPTDICDWNGVTLSPASGNPVYLGVTGCKEFDLEGNGDTQLYARDIFLFGNRLAGTLPDEIGYLRRLEILSLFTNPGLSGEIVPGVLNLSHLEDLELHYCAISGTLPEEIGTLRTLTNLGLSNNILVGTIPESLFEMTRLQWLFLDDNILEGDISEFGRLTNLYGLYAEDTGIYGELTSELLSSWTNLYELDLSTNLLDGLLPDNLLSHPTLQIIDLHQNKIEGPLPDVPGPNKSLRFLSLYTNEIFGTIPTTIGNLGSLAHLDLGLNEFVLPLPTEIGSLTSLRYLFMNNNNFSDHEIPKFLTRLTHLRELSMKDNNLIGTIPTELAALSKLLFLDLDRNKLDGTIPSQISLMTNLAFLFLNRNRLTGTLPSAMTTMYTLSAVLLDGNSLNGTADVICTDPFINVRYFSSDCLGPEPEFECSCCTVCCHDSNVTCNNFEWTLNLDPIWEFGHGRVRWEVDWDLLDEEENP